MTSSAPAPLPLRPPAGVRVQLLRYAIAGAPAFLADAGTLVALRGGLALPLAAAVAIASVAGSLVNYALCTRWVFPRRSVPDRRLELAAFVAVGFAGMGVNVAVVWLLVTRLSIHYLVAKVVAALVVLGTGFTGRKALLFRDARRHRPRATAPGAAADAPRASSRAARAVRARAG